MATTDLRDLRSLALARSHPGFNSMDHVLGWTQPSKTVTCAMRPGQGAPSCADPRPMQLMGHGLPSGVVTGGASTTSGRFSYADQRPLNLTLFEDRPNAYTHKYGVTCANREAATVTTATDLGRGAQSYADPITTRFKGSLGVLDAREASGAVTCEAYPSTGPFSYASPPPTPLDLEPQKGNADRHWDKYAVRPWDAAALTVHGATRIGSGAPSVAQPLAMKEGNFHHGAGLGKMGVLPLDEVSSAVTGNARIATGPYSVADDVPAPPAAAPAAPVDLVPREKCFDKAYAVINRAVEPSNTIAGTSAVGCGAYAITDEVPTPLALGLGCAPHAGAYGVIPAEEPAPAVVAAANIDNSRVALAARPAPPPFVVLSYAEAKRVADGHVTVPFAIVDRDHPDVPLAIVEDMAKPPFRWVDRPAKGKKGQRGATERVKVPVPLVLIAKDGTWHRPLTTLELAVLQGLPWQHRGQPLNFGGGATQQRRTIGNMIPAPVGEAFGNQFLAAGLASAAGALFMYGPSGGLWVHPERFEELRRAGVRRVRQQDLAKIAPGETVLLDDAAPPLRRKRTTIPKPPRAIATSPPKRRAARLRPPIPAILP